MMNFLFGKKRKKRNGRHRKTQSQRPVTYFVFQIKPGLPWFAENY